MSKIPKLCSALLPFAFVAAHALAAGPNVYVVDFTTRTMTKDSTTQKFTYDFELALAQVGCFNVLETRQYSRLLAEIDREQAITDIVGLSNTTVHNLKTQQVDMVVFGEVYDDVDSGQVHVTVTFQKLDRTKALIKAALVARGKINDAPSRQEAMKLLARSLCSRTASIQRISTNDFIFDIQKCQLQERDLSCHLLVTNNGEDRSLFISAVRHRTTEKRYSSAYDDSSMEYRPHFLRLGSQQGESFAESLLVSGRPAKLELFFKDVNREASLVSLLRVECWESEHKLAFTANLRNIPIERSP